MCVCIHKYIYICIYTCIYACILGCFIHVQLFTTLWNVACQAPLSMGFPRQGSWSRLPFPPLVDLPDPATERLSRASPTLQVDSLPLSHLGSPLNSLKFARSKHMSWVAQPLLCSCLPSESPRPPPRTARADMVPGGSFNSQFLSSSCLLQTDGVANQHHPCFTWASWREIGLMLK